MTLSPTLSAPARRYRKHPDLRGLTGTQYHAAFLRQWRKLRPSLKKTDRIYGQVFAKIRKVARTRLAFTISDLSGITRRQAHQSLAFLIRRGELRIITRATLGCRAKEAIYAKKKERARPRDRFPQQSTTPALQQSIS